MASNPATLGKTGKNGDLKHRLGFLLLALVVYRIGTHIPVPGIDPDQLRQLFNSQQGGILGLFNMFSGGALSRFSVFALGIMPSALMGVFFSQVGRPVWDLFWEPS